MTTAAITAGRVDTIASTVAERDWQIDVAKALAIILVALGHASGMPPAYKLFAYSFHVPLFFVLSGWVGERFGRRAFGRKTVGKLARTLLIPYVSFFLVAYGYWILSAVLNGTSQSWAGHPWWHPFVGLLWANGSSLWYGFTRGLAVGIAGKHMLPLCSVKGVCWYKLRDAIFCY